ncbi:MAG: hypothetical protein LLG01_03130 [Planctomycetaceae bacterium]|nr:hypothetical protein [Planctomycetaceae bacterium]
MAQYDEMKLLDLLADGVAYEQVAQEIGISRSMVAKIAQGRTRPEIHQQLLDIREARRQAVHDLAAKKATTLMRMHIEEGLARGGETARKCREFILDRLLTRDDTPADMLDKLLADSAKADPSAAELAPRVSA